MYEIERSTQFKKDFKLMKKRNKDLKKLNEVISILAKGEKLPQKYRDHALEGSLENLRECHIEPDWLLMYRINNQKLYLYLARTGTHCDLF